MNMFNASSATTPQEYFDSLPEPRKTGMKKIDAFIRKKFPKLPVKIWSGMPGYGTYHFTNAKGEKIEWYFLGISSRKTGISVYVCAIDTDKKYVAEKHAKELKAIVGKSCIRYKKFEDIDFDVLGKVLDEAKKVADN